jgi:hypothetical protein
MVVLHNAILMGEFAIVPSESRVWKLVILIVGKTILEVELHQTERTESR